MRAAAMRHDQALPPAMTDKLNDPATAFGSCGWKLGCTISWWTRRWSGTVSGHAVGWVLSLKTGGILAVYARAQRASASWTSRDS